MYADFYGLRELPFNITPDPRFLYLNDCYQEALAALGYGVDARKGFISLIGEAGTGKTTLLRRLLDSISPSTRTVLLLNPTVAFEEILEHILLELGVPPDGGRKLVLLQRLNEFLIEHTRSGGNVALLIDEAQDLKPEVLEELRLLSNLETAREKILQIVLAGQPELDEILANPGLRQLRQRVTLRIRLRPLSSAEVALYVRTRLEQAGAAGSDLFSPGALARVAELSQGIPRLVNVLCDASLLAAFASGSHEVTRAIVDDAWADYAVDLVPVAPPAEPPTATAPLSPVPAAAPIARPSPPAPAPPPPAPAAPPAPSVEPAAASVGEAIDRPVEARAPSHRPPVAALAPITPPRSPHAMLGIPVAAVVALLAVALSIGRVRFQTKDVGNEVVTKAQRADAGTGLPSPEDATAAEPPAAATHDGAAEPEPAITEHAAAPDASLSLAEATAVVDDFRAAYEARDIQRLIALFTPDASANGVHGTEAIASVYRASFGDLSAVHYSMPRFSVESHGPRAGVRGPFVIAYEKLDGVRGEVHGQAEWALERRDGHVRIVALDYRFDPES